MRQYVTSRSCATVGSRSKACAASAGARPRVGAHKSVSAAARGGAQERERGQRGDRRRHAAGEAVFVQEPAPQRARSARASRPGDRTGGGGAHTKASLVSAAMLARIGPVKPFSSNFLIVHSEACGRAEDGPPTHRRALAQRRMRRVGGEPGRAKGAHRTVSAVSAEIAGGTLPTRPG
jgi:hypothetical protein